MRRLSLLVLVLCAAIAAGSSTAIAQGTKADYERANSLGERFRDKVTAIGIQPTWCDNETRFWYVKNLIEGRREFILVDAATGNKSPAFDHAKLAEALAAAASKPVDRERMNLDRLAIDGTEAKFRAFDKDWIWSLTEHQLREVAPPPPESKPAAPEQANNNDESSTILEEVFPSSDFALDPPQNGRRSRRANPEDLERSPDKAWRAFLKDRNVWLSRPDAAQEPAPFALTTDGKEGDEYTRFLWSPDSKRLLVFRTTPGTNRQVHMIESSPKDQLQPKLKTISYDKPGDNLPQHRLAIVDIASKSVREIAPHLYANHFFLEEFRWVNEGKKLTFLFNPRGHQSLKLIVVDAETAEAGVLIDERSDTFVDYAHKAFHRFVDESNELIWMSERDGWCHLYLFDARTGQLKNPITSGQWIVRGVEHVDPQARKIWLRCGGLFPEQDPYYVHHAVVNFDGTGFTPLTEGNGHHRAVYSPGRKQLVVVRSRADAFPVTELRSGESGRLIAELETSDASALVGAGWVAPERFVAKGRDGQTDIYGLIYRPTNFDPAKKYPVIEYIYAGPHSAFVQKSFNPFFYYGQATAELGFIVVQIDGLGTSQRSKKFHDVAWKNIGDSGFADRIAWMKAAAAKYGQLDLSRVGIFGGSAGGQSTLRALLEHGDFYKVGVADCGCHDNRMDKIWWNELWMGWPIGEHYAAQSNVTNAHKLTGKLLLTVGELDTNVDPASTMQVVNALIKADKDFDLLVVPGAEHGAGESPYGRRRRFDFFVRHLLGVEPRRE